VLTPPNFFPYDWQCHRKIFEDDDFRHYVYPAPPVQHLPSDRPLRDIPSNGFPSPWKGSCKIRCILIYSRQSGNCVRHLLCHLDVVLIYVALFFGYVSGGLTFQANKHASPKATTSIPSAMQRRVWVNKSTPVRDFCESSTSFFAWRLKIGKTNTGTLALKK